VYLEKIMKIRSTNLLMIFSIALVLSITVKAETFTANLSGVQEVPANASTATGFARMFVNEATMTLNYTIVFSNLSGTQTGAHIHAPAAIGVNVGVAVAFPNIGGTSGTIMGSTTITALQLSQIRQNLGYVNVHSAVLPGGEIRGQLAKRRVLDFDGDGKTDYSVLRFPSVAPPGVAQITYWNRNSLGLSSNQSIPWGNANTDFPAPGDYDGDGKDDLSLYRAGASAGLQSFFLILRSLDNTVQFAPWGLFGDQAMARDYDGDGITDLAIFRRGAVAADQAVWWIRQSSNGAARVVAFGLTGNGTSTFDTPIPGDYDGDGKFDIAVYRFGLTPINNYIVQRSSDNVTTFQQWGNFNTDYIAPGDFDGDGKFDLVAARTGATGTPMTWFIRRSSDNATRIQQFGLSQDIPTQGDYDGDGITDISVFRAAASGTDSAFYTFASFTNSFLANNWGLNGDFAVNGFDAR
jgi:CHRD domain/FG-GAP-like repeat/FG-GAP repeat